MVRELLSMERLELLGRESEMNRIESAAQVAKDEQQAIAVFLRGKGGIGKTHLLKHLQHHFQNKGIPWLVGSIIDLDQPEHATPPGLSRAMVLSLTAQGTWQDLPEEVRRAWEEVEIHFPKGEVRQLQDAWQQWEEAICKFIRGKAKENQVLFLLFDTAEWLRFALEENGPSNHQERPWDVNVGAWLLEHCTPRMANMPVVLLFAGRPPEDEEGEDRLERALRERFGERLHLIDLGALSPQDARRYLEAVTELIRPEDATGAERIQRYLEQLPTPSQEDQIYRMTQGHPLYLAILADALRVGIDPARVMQESRVPVDTLFQEILRRLFSKRSPLGWALLFLSRTRLGANQQMLREAYPKFFESELPAEEGIQHILDRLRTLSIVKHFPDRRRAFFLHDEVYRIINQQWPPSTEEREIVQEVALKDYGKEMDELEAEAERYEHPPHGWRQRYIENRIGQIYYRLWHEPWNHYDFYLAWANDWAKGDPLAFRRLQRILFRLQRWLFHIERRKDASTKAFWDFWRLERKLHESALYISRYSDLERGKKRLQEVIQAWDALQVPARQILRILYALARALLDFRSRNFQNYAQSLERAHEALEETKPLVRQQPTGIQKALRFLEAMYWNYEGMRQRRRGAFGRAYKLFQQAVARYRRYQVDGLAGILVNLAYLNVLQVRDRTARDLLNEALAINWRTLDWRTEIRIRTVQALMENLTERFDEAIEATQQTLQICKRTDWPRYRALVLMYWARALRGKWNRKVKGLRRAPRMQSYITDYLLPALRLLLPWKEVKGSLPQDLQEAAQSLWEKSIRGVGFSFDETGKDLILEMNPEERSEMRREIGRLFRELAWGWREIRRLSGVKDDQVLREETRPLNRQAEAYLWKAALGEKPPFLGRTWWAQARPDDEVAQALHSYIQEINGDAFYPLSAMLDLAWHMHYQHALSPEAEHRWIKEWFLPQFPEGYVVYLAKARIDEEITKWPPARAQDEEETDPRLWGLLGKAFMLLGHTHLRQIRHRQTPAERRERIEAAVHHIALAFEYDHLLGGHSYGVRRAEANLHDWLIRHGGESVDGQTIQQIFIQTVRKLNKKWHAQHQGRTLHLYKFAEERFGFLHDEEE